MDKGQSSLRKLLEAAENNERLAIEGALPTPRVEPPFCCAFPIGSRRSQYVTCEGLRVKGLYWEAETEHLHAVFCSVLQCQLTSARSSQLPSGVNRRLDELRELLESADDEAWKGRK